jgi:hypothetical protein
MGWGRTTVIHWFLVAIWKWSKVDRMAAAASDNWRSLLNSLDMSERKVSSSLFYRIQHYLIFNTIHVQYNPSNEKFFISFLSVAILGIMLTGEK